MCPAFRDCSTSTPANSSVPNWKPCTAGQFWHHNISFTHQADSIRAKLFAWLLHISYTLIISQKTFLTVYQQAFWTWKWSQNDSEPSFFLPRVVFLLVFVNIKQTLQTNRNRGQGITRHIVLTMCLRQGRVPRTSWFTFWFISIEIYVVVDTSLIPKTLLNQSI